MDSGGARNSLLSLATWALTLVLVAVPPSRLAAQGLPTEPLSIAGGRVVLSGELGATIAPEDPGYFNYTDYEYNLLRNVRAGVIAEGRLNTRVQILADVRVDRGRALRPYGLYVRVRPWPERRVAVQLGRIPPTFGAFSRYAYANDNPLIGTPLAYQYLTSLRSDALPAGAEELLEMRGRGWRTSFSTGNSEPGPGLPLVNTTRWDTGVQLHAATRAVEGTFALTTGTVSNPRVVDDNGGRQAAGRFIWRPSPGLGLGISIARGAYLSRAVHPAATRERAERAAQRAAAIDVEYARGKLSFRGEWLWSAWDVPWTASPARVSLGAHAVHGEARYKLLPGLYLAARVERLGFDDVASRGTAVPWDFAVRRAEAVAGWSVHRNVLVKAGWQRNTRDGGRVRREGLWCVQASYWF